MIIKTHRIFLGFVVVMLGCGASEQSPVDLYPEDMCASCRMAISNPAFAAELITADGEVNKFDDIGCLDRFRTQHPAEMPVTVFYVDYESGSWLPESRALVLKTGLKSPMGSGKIAVADSSTATRILQEHPIGEMQ